MQPKNVLQISLIGLAAVLIGVSIIEPLSQVRPRLEPFLPMIVITGFFVFLVSTALCIYAIISMLKK